MTADGFLDLRTDAPWWTPPDTAELDERVWAMVNAVYDHSEEGCEICTRRAETGIGCSSVQQTIEAVVEFRDRRETTNRLRWIRLAHATSEPPRPSPISIARLVAILRETS